MLVSRAHLVHLEPYSIQPTIILLHQHTTYDMSSIEYPKQLSLRTGQTSHNALGINAPLSPAYKSAPADSSVHYTCFIRLPFPRGDFVDPPQVLKTKQFVFPTHVDRDRSTGTQLKIVRCGKSSLRLLTAKSWTVCIILC